MELEQAGLLDDFDEQIRYFWQEVKNGSDKLKLLSKMSEVKVVPKKQPGSIRNEFVQQGYKLNMRRDEYCFVCQTVSTARHHIILIKNGGRNQAGNIVALCYQCHKHLHPWITVSKYKHPLYKPPLKYVLTKERLRRKTYNK